MRVLVLVAAALFTVVVAGLWPSRAAHPWIYYGTMLCAVIGWLGVVESLVVRVELHDDEIRVVEPFRRRRYSRDSISSVKWEKGGPVALRLRNETWARLPGTGHANTKMAGAIRAWLNESLK
jgi:hypothetical protein